MNLLPMLFIDFDGVINVFPDAKAMRRGGFQDTISIKQDHPRYRLYHPDHAYKPSSKATVTLPGYHNIKLRWSPVLVDDLTRLVDNGSLAWTWLSTWRPYIRETLDPLLGTPPFHISEWYTGSPRTLQSHAGKYGAVHQFMKEQPDRPVIWIDDEECEPYAYRELTAEFPSTPLLMIQPNDEIGISKPMMTSIKEFCKHPYDHGSLMLSESWSRIQDDSK